MKRIREGLIAAVLIAVGAAGCADLDVTNPNEPNQQRALQTAGDLESLIAGSFNTWFNGTYSYDGPGLFLSNASFQHTAPWANAAMEQYARLPRIGIINDPADVYYGNFTQPWYQMHSALASVADGLRALEADADLADDLGAERVTRAKAYGKFVQGMAHASVAVLYDRGFIIDETVAVKDESGTPLILETVPYTEVMDAALGYFAEAASLASGQDFIIPDSWMSVEVSADELVRVAHSMAARYRAAVARTPEERAAVDWNAVIADVDAGITSDWVLYMDANNEWYNEVVDYGTYPGWSENPYFIIGMADQSGSYQRWLDIPLGDRIANPASGPILIVTPDTRFPQGSTVDEQEASPGSRYVIPDWGIGNVWARPDRGSWRWSYYWHVEGELYTYWEDFNWPEIDIDEMQLLKAEGLYRNGNMAGAAGIINVSRQAAGLDATDAAGTNTSCVPRLPDESCGDLWEMLKWEKRMEVRMKGLFSAPWYFDSRAWGDLYKGTYLQLPAPCRELQILGVLPCYTFGGPNDFAADGSTYAWPSE